MENPESFEEFRKALLKVSEPKNYEITNSLGVYDAYKYIRKNKWFDIGKPLKESEFYKIIRTVGKTMAEQLSQGEDIILPLRMGTLEIRKKKSKLEFVDGKLKTSLPIDWKATHYLWFEDEEARTNKLLVRRTEDWIFKIKYNKSFAIYNNKEFYSFAINRGIRLKLKDNIKQGTVDAFLENYQRQ